MRIRGWLVLAGMLVLVWVPGDEAYGQRGGRGGGVRAGGAAYRGGGGRGGVAYGGSRSAGVAAGPYGAGGARHSTGTVVGPNGGSRSAGTTRGSYTTGRGTTIDYAGAGRSRTGPGGATAGRAVGGVHVTTPSGQTGTRVGSAGGVRGPGGSGVAAGRSVGGTTGPYGTGVGASRGGVAVGPGGAVAGGSRVGAATGPGGRTVAGGSRGGVAVGPGGAVAGGSRVGAATGPGGRTVAGASHWSAASNPYGAYRSASRGVAVAGRAGHYTSYRSAATVRTHAGYVRTGFTGYHYFNANWYRAHPRAWQTTAWVGSSYWRWAPYATVATFCGFAPAPVVYDYGSRVVYEGEQVYYDGEPVATAEQYATQAVDLASAGQAATPDEKDTWQSLGVFAMVQGDEKEANHIFQLAINRDRVIRGNYHNALTDTTLPIYGSVDKRSQRAAWAIGDKKDTVFETGVGNLSQPETSMLVHVGKDRTQQWTLVRLEPPEVEK